MTTTIDLDYRPVDEADLFRCLKDPVWRICSGALYKIMIKSSDDDEGTVIPFKPNRAQVRLMKRLWHRNIILKARQLGFTTMIAIMWLDHALFNSDQRVGIVAQDKDAAEGFFRDKVKLAYDRLPEALKAAIPVTRDSASELLFSNNSSIRVATSMRSGTIHRLHVSELGKISAKYPEKAREVVTGTLPAVPLDGIAVIESTAEGQDGEFFRMTMRAMSLQQKGVALSQKDYRFHFFPWWGEPGYRMESAGGAVESEADLQYFAEVEEKTGTKLSQQQRNWYLATRDSEFSGDPEKMWQEYPSYPEEAFKQSVEGAYYTEQLTAANLQRRIGVVPHVDGYPVNTFWDIGSGDGTGVWLHQEVGAMHRFIGYIEGWGLPYSHYVSELQKIGVKHSMVWGVHHLPHDADHKRQQGDRVESAKEALQRVSGIGGEWHVVPRVDDVTHGIRMVKSEFSQYWFDEAGCKEGLAHLQNYRRVWNRSTSSWGGPRHDEHSEAADALRQKAQGYRRPSSATSHSIFDDPRFSAGRSPATSAGY